jgi:ABC-type uncharacterized transport system involved in gliding motility auxiliary subunit
VKGFVIFGYYVTAALMNRFLMFVLFVTTSGCKSTIDSRQVLLDSLKREYAGKEVHLTFTNNEAGTEPITSQYAYIDRKKSDLAFELKQSQSYNLAFEEGIPFVPTTNNPEKDKSDMVLIEIPNTTKRGFVSYKYINEFKEISAFDR